MSHRLSGAGLERNTRRCYACSVSSKALRNLLALDLEERILNAATAVSLVSVGLPWIGGDWTGGESVTYTGFGFSTAYIGIAVFFLNAFILLLTIVPLAGGPVIFTKRQRELTRMWTSAQVVILTLAALTVLMRTAALEFTRLDVRFGIYVCLIASLIAFFEACQRYIGYRKSLPQELFHHPEDHASADAQESFAPPPPPPPPPPALPPEEHRLHP